MKQLYITEMTSETHKEKASPWGMVALSLALMPSSAGLSIWDLRPSHFFGTVLGDRAGSEGCTLLDFLSMKPVLYVVQG